MSAVSDVERLGTACMVAAVAHTFAVGRFRRLASCFEAGSLGENLFHWLAETEVVFGLWAIVWLLGAALIEGGPAAIARAEGANFTEPLFVFAILVIASTRAVVEVAERGVAAVSRVLPLPRELRAYVAILTIGPLLGSLITEPAAMTVTALLLGSRFLVGEASARFKHATLAVLFVNVSIGGVLTPYAAPPVLMVAREWGWDLRFMLVHFGWKAALAVLLNALLMAVWFRRELGALDPGGSVRNLGGETARPTPGWLRVAHLALLGLVVASSHHPVVFIGVLLMFMGLADVTREHQGELRLRESLLVSFFLAGLVILGGVQGWWVAPLLRSLNDTTLFLGATALTAVTDNAALTYLGSRVPGISDAFKHALVAGAVAGGGLTVIANAPNPAGYAILRESFGPQGIGPLRLFGWALLPTAVAMACLWVL